MQVEPGVLMLQESGAGSLDRNSFPVRLIHPTSVWISRQCTVWHMNFNQALICQPANRDLHQTASVIDLQLLKCHLGSFYHSLLMYNSCQSSCAFVCTAAWSVMTTHNQCSNEQRWTLIIRCKAYNFRQWFRSLVMVSGVVNGRQDG